MLIGRYHHPIWTLMAAMVLVAAGIGQLWAGLPVIAAGLVAYGAGIGIESIARGTLPLALFGASSYATRLGPEGWAWPADPLRSTMVSTRPAKAAALVSALFGWRAQRAAKARNGISSARRTVTRCVGVSTKDTGVVPGSSVYSST